MMPGPHWKDRRKINDDPEIDEHKPCNDYSIMDGVTSLEPDTSGGPNDTTTAPVAVPSSTRKLRSSSNDNYQSNLDTAMLPEFVSRYILTFGIDTVILPAAVTVPNTYKEAAASRQVDELMSLFRSTSEQ